MTITRFAPSPTGYLHVGNLRTALMNYLIAHKAGGRFILRIDDTDPVRSKPEYDQALREDLRWLGLKWDRLERQSTRLARYRQAAQHLRDGGRLYECFETPAELALKRRGQLARGRPPVYDRAALALSADERAALRQERGNGYWRFKLEWRRIAWQDGILGAQSIDAASVSDPVLIRGDGQVLYTLASVVDDMEMGITHVVRGADHITNTATQIQLMAALHGSAPVFAHHALLVGSQGESLSKRLGVLGLRQLRDAGAEPAALLSLMARLGSSQPIQVQLSLDALAQGFDLSQFGGAPTRFSRKELDTLGARVLARLPAEAVADEMAAAGVPPTLVNRFWQTIRENITNRQEIAHWWRICAQGAAPAIAPEDEAFVAQALAMLPPPPYDGQSWQHWTQAVQNATGRKGRALFMPLRKALTGQSHGPDMAALLPLLQGFKAGQSGQTATR